MSMRAKQVIVVRGDLNFGSKGKLAAQVAHASMGAVFSEALKIANDDGPEDYLAVPYTLDLEKWFTEKFTKIVVKCKDEQELLDLAQKCKDNGIRHSLIKDAGDTVFGEPTYTCLGVGPEMENTVDLITKHLKLM